MWICAKSGHKTCSINTILTHDNYNIFEKRTEGRVFISDSNADKANDHGFNIPYPTAFPYGNGMVLHFYQQQESSTTKTVHKVINRGLKAYV